MALTRYGLREWLAATLIAVPLAAILVLAGWWWAAVPVAAGWLAVAMFFRDPRRTIPQGLSPAVMLSPADGTVSAVVEIQEHEAIGGPAVVVRIFLSVLDVHVNRAPCDGVVLATRHRPGRFHDARTPQSAVENENALMTLRTDGGRQIGVRQIAGRIARRIVCDLRPGDRLRRGERFGMIKFGSSAELILPRAAAVKVHVREGERVRGGVTQLATLEA